MITMCTHSRGWPLADLREDVAYDPKPTPRSMTTVIHPSRRPLPEARRRAAACFRYATGDEPTG